MNRYIAKNRLFVGIANTSKSYPPSTAHLGKRFIVTVEKRGDVFRTRINQRELVMVRFSGFQAGKYLTLNFPGSPFALLKVELLEVVP
jgi:hypothetical protein